jgi:hypothetical protein
MAARSLANAFFGAGDAAVFMQVSWRIGRRTERQRVLGTASITAAVQLEV